MYRYYFFDCLFKTTYPNIPPMIEATKIPIFACVMCSSLVKAKDVINNDIVKPIEANKPSPKRFLILIPSGNGAFFNFTNNQVKPTTPTTFPTKRPSETPKATFVLKSCSKSIATETPAFAKAKIGIII